MQFVSKYRLTQCFNEGRKNEELVMSALTSTWGGQCWKSTPKEDREKHIDIWWKTKKDNIVSIDAKKKSKDLDEGYHWAEAKNVHGGKGSIYGESKYISFTCSDKIILAEREQIVKLYEEKVKPKDVVTKKPKEAYIPYTRKNSWKNDDGSPKQDEIFILKDEDLLNMDNTLVINFDKTDD